MSSCCERDSCTITPTATNCPVSRTPGAQVDLQTVKALLTTSALQRLEPGAYRFCSAPECDVVYFDDLGHTFSTADVRVGVWQKQAEGGRVVCYCFGENESDMRAEIARDGRSHAAERVRAHIQAGRCACEVRNPRGACCLGDVTAAVKRLAAAAVRANDLCCDVRQNLVAANPC
jgi:CopZ-like zinc binding protein